MNTNNMNSDEVVKELSQDENSDKQDVMELISSCNSFSELIDKLCIENVRLWHILDDSVSLKKELDEPNISQDERVKILEKIAKKSSENIEVVKRRSAFKKAIDEIFERNVNKIVEGKDINVCKENKSYGR